MPQGPPVDYQQLIASIDALTAAVNNLLVWDSQLFLIGVEHALFIMVLGFTFGGMSSVIRNKFGA